MRGNKFTKLTIENLKRLHEKIDEFIQENDEDEYDEQIVDSDEDELRTKLIDMQGLMR